MWEAPNDTTFSTALASRADAGAQAPIPFLWGDFVMTIDEYKRVNERPFPSWSAMRHPSAMRIRSSVGKVTFWAIARTGTSIIQQTIAAVVNRMVRDVIGIHTLLSNALASPTRVA